MAGLSLVIFACYSNYLSHGSEGPGFKPTSFFFQARATLLMCLAFVFAGLHRSDEPSVERLLPPRLSFIGRVAAEVHGPHGPGASTPLVTSS